MVRQGALEGNAYADLNTLVNAITIKTKFPFESFCETVIQAADSAASQLAQKSPLPEAELSRLVRILQGF